LRLIVTADLHLNHSRSRTSALEAIVRINDTEGDALLLVGDTGVADDDSLERVMTGITFPGPKLFLCGNHELWTAGPDSYRLFTEDLPRRVRACGWQWLESDPLQIGDVAVVGSVGWYDYGFAVDTLGIPRRFYEAKVSPGGAERLSAFRHLVDADVPLEAMEIVARWNDGKFVKLGRSDEAFLEERLDALRRSLASVSANRVVAAVHHVPLAELLPPRHKGTFDFVRAYLGSPRLGELLLSDPRVTHVLCGHSHFGVDTQIGSVRAINVGSGYGHKNVLTLDV
jgi:predicted phosphohydrolase